MKKIGYELMSKSALIEIIRVKDEQLKGKEQRLQEVEGHIGEIIEQRKQEVMVAARGIIDKREMVVKEELRKEVEKREHVEKAAKLIEQAYMAAKDELQLYKQACEELLKAHK